MLGAHSPTHSSSSSSTSKMVHRRATHSGSWYSSEETVLSSQLTQWLSIVSELPLPNETNSTTPPPIPEAKMLIAPHAGYTYSGPTAAYAYSALDTSNIERVILLGPSHHVYIDGCGLSPCEFFDTPLGSFPASDLTAFKKSNLFSMISVKTDEAEHSLEMQLPYLYKRFQDDNRPIPSLILMLVGRLKSVDQTELYANFLSTQVDSKTAWIISTDFCHFGPRFKYTPTFNDSHFIHEGIQHMDEEAMALIQTLNVDGFREYLLTTKNTICGRFPLILFMHVLLCLKQQQQPKYSCSIVWTHYAQSSKILTNVKEHSVSYVSGYVQIKEELAE